MENTGNNEVEQYELRNQKGIVEALIFASAEPITAAELASVSGLTRQTVDQIVVELNEDYSTSGRSFRIEHVASGYKFYTLPDYHAYINKANLIERTHKLSQAALESLAVIAYKQPVTRVEIERIRGVDCGGVLKNLMAKNLIIIDGRSPAPGNPILYRTSEYFLEFFGLSSLDELPQLAEIEEYAEGLPKLKLIKPGEDDDNNSDATGDGEIETADSDVGYDETPEPDENSEMSFAEKESSES